jgi:hypothetical protein
MSIAIVRDLFTGRQMARVMSLAMMVFIVIPVLAPALGQLMMTAGNWRTPLDALLVFGVLAAAWTAWRLPETRVSLPGDEGGVSLLESAKAVLSVPQTVGYMLGSGFMFGCLMGYIASKLDDVKDMASRSRTPAQYLLGDLSNVNGETLVASESGLVSKCGQRSRGMNGGLEGSARMSRKLAGLSSPGDQSMEAMWKNPGFRTEGELVSALVQMGTLGVPQEALWERWGASQEEIARWKTMAAEQQRQQAMNDATALLGENFRNQQDARVTGSIGGRTPRRPSGRTTGGSGSAGAGGNGTGRPGGAGVAKATPR